jgi:hypothetical protein
MQEEPTMSVMQRKLFANKEARTKLRDMGGIMSSFPELSGEVQRFQAGGGVTPGFSPPVPSVYDQLVAESLLERTSREPRPRRGGTPRATPFEMPLDLNLSETTAQPNPRRRGQEETAAPAPVVTERPVPDPERLSRKELRDLRATQPPVEVFKNDTEEPAPAEEEAAPTTEQRIADLLPTTEETPDVTTDETGNGDTPDLRARAEDRIKLFQDLFGSDEPTARDRAMQFAMIGLAIAAGQSPNALTNIASGLLAGTQAMTAQEAERRKERRDLRSSAVTSVLNEIEAERKAAAEAAKRSGEDYQPTESYADAVLKMTDTLIKEGEDPVAADRLARQLVDPLYGRGTPVDTGTVERGRQLVQQLRDSGRTDTEIARLVREAGLDPADLGVTDGQ